MNPGLSSVSRRSISSVARVVHFFGRDRPPPRRLEHTSQSRRGQFRQQDDAAIRMNEEFDLISRLEPEMVPNGLRDRRLTFACDRGLHPIPLHL
jgi:hypothetical protein